MTRLHGRSVLLTRSAGAGRSLSERLRTLGARVESRPAVHLVPPQDPAACAEAVSHLGRYDWVLFTSANGVRFFFSVLRRMAPPSFGAKVGAIGSVTAAALAAQGTPAAVVARQNDSEGFVAALSGQITTGQRVLLVRPERARRVLRDALLALGAELDAVVFYRNIPPDDIDAIARDVSTDRYDVVVLHSPSALQHLLDAAAGDEAIRRALRRSAIVAVGGITASALEQAGVVVSAVAKEASDDGILDAICAL